MKMLGVVYPEPVERSGANVGDAGEIAALFSLKRVKRSLCIPIGALLQNEIQVLRLRCPHPEMRPVWSERFGTDRITTSSYRFHASILSSDNGFAAVLFGFEVITVSKLHEMRALAVRA